MAKKGLLDLILKNIEDTWVRENFRRIQDFAAVYPMFRGEWKFFELTFTGAVTNQLIPHGLAFVPKDILQTSLVGAGALTWVYEQFDRTNLVVTTTGPLTVRAFVGAYEEIT